jgi:peptidoglycan-N-acetylglucosamine deacetylase
MPVRHRPAAMLFALAWLLPVAALAATPPAAQAPARLAPTVRGVPIAQKVVALTFDDGPSPRYTQQILDALRQNGARATFFLIGQEAVRQPALVKAEAKAGMEVANHGMHHLLLRGKSESEVESEATEAADVIQELTGKRPTLYRLPQGVGDTTARAALGRLGYVVINWSVDTRDYLRQSPEQLVARAMRQMAPGRIIIFHDGGGNRQASVDAVKMLLPELKAQGYTVTTVSDLLKRAGYRAPAAAATGRHSHGRAGGAA